MAMNKLAKRTRDITVFAMLGALLFASKLAFEALPNIHPVGMLLLVYTVVYRVKALIPLYIFVFLTGLYGGFNLWWIPYLYIWTVLWAAVMLLPKRMPKWLAPIVYCAVCGLFGLSYGTLYAPTQAIISGYTFSQTLAWISTGLYFDFLHCIGNTVITILAVPLIKLLTLLERKTVIKTIPGGDIKKAARKTPNG